MALEANLRRILMNLQGDIAINVQLCDLLPYLMANGLLTEGEYHGLSGSIHESPYDKNCRLLNIILRKGEKAFDLFVEALRKEKKHTGHQSLANRLLKEKEKPAIPSRNRTGILNSSPRPSPRSGRRQTLSTLQEIRKDENVGGVPEGHVQQINNQNNSPALPKVNNLQLIVYDALKFHAHPCRCDR